MGKGKKRCCLDMSKPVPTIFDPSPHVSSSTSALKAPIRIPRKSRKKRNVFADEYVEFVNNDKIMKFESIDETLAPPGYAIAKHEVHIVLYKVERNELSIPQVTECIVIDDKLHVKLYYKGCPVPLPKWFHHGHLSTCKIILQRLSSTFTKMVPPWALVKEKYARKLISRLWFDKIKQYLMN